MAVLKEVIGEVTSETRPLSGMVGGVSRGAVGRRRKKKRNALDEVTEEVSKEPVPEGALAQVMRDIVDYHATPEQAADAAKAAGVDALVLNHLVPPQPLAYGYAAFLGDAQKHFDGPITVGEDGMLFSLPQGGDKIISKRLF